VSNDTVREAVCSQVVTLLRGERKKRAISMETLARRSGLSQSMISLVERDLRNPTLDTLLRIAGALEVDLVEILVRARRAAAKGK